MPSSIDDSMSRVLERAYNAAEKVVENEWQSRVLKYEPARLAYELAQLKHAFRGVGITLLSYKIINPMQDVRSHKDELPGGFSARGYDSRVTVPFLIEKSLPRSVETHWLTQTISFAGVLHRDQNLKTNPKNCGPLLIQVVNTAEECNRPKIVWLMLLAIMVCLIEERNRDKVITTRPKALPIDKVKWLLHCHFEERYKANAPRLPQLAIYAVYQCLMENMERFRGKTLDNLGRMKAADRKAGTVGDIVVLKDGKPSEAVEIKYGHPISYIHVCEAVEKVRSGAVSRYYLLSTNGVESGDRDRIEQKKYEFLRQNGCEIIVNGVIETVGYYLRLLPDTTVFLNNYAGLVESDEDTAYEHRIAWNEVCKKI